MTQQKVVLDEDDIRRTLVRIAHEIVEKHAGRPVALVGIHRRGAHLATPPAPAGRATCSRREVPLGDIDIAFYRDDLSTRAAPIPRSTRPTCLPARGLHASSWSTTSSSPGRTARAGDRRAVRLRAPRARAARRAGRPRPPRAADPPRLRRQEPADLARRARQRPGHRGRRRRRGGHREPARSDRVRHLLSIEDLDRRRHRAHPRPRQVLHRGLRARDQEGARPARPPRAEPLLRGLHAHALELRAGGQVAVAPTSSTSPPAARASRRASRSRTPSRRSRAYQPDLIVIRTPHVGAAELVAGLDDRERRQRRRRQARAPDPGAARRLHAARAARRARRPQHLDRRRRHALARGALEHPRLHQDGRQGDRVRPADADPARDRGARLRGRATRSTASARPTSSTRCGCSTSG